MPDGYAMAATAPLSTWFDRDGALLRMRLARPKANLIDAAMIAALHGALRDARGRSGLRGVLLDAEGAHFSFGASVDEHRAENCAAMLSSLHALIVAMLEFPAPILVAVRGQCLGGGLEVALACATIFATPDATLGQPEMKLGVFAPAASCLLPYRVGQATAEDLLFSGRGISGAEAKTIGLVDVLADDPAQAALAYFDAHLAPRSAAALAFAIQAVRAPLAASVASRLADVERLYVNALMKTHDANEGIAAFLAKRQPSWEHR
ncbi:MAG TPA: cyclohexa-1,5-dienecarbonyl-CoA hydratase [Casimicrobiaceae bacterium]|nr:cyclohexa-1,5-dienecarbonyl-CoA hydratase [Casimicrobiaceae bacterium]